MSTPWRHGPGRAAVALVAGLGAALATPGLAEAQSRPVILVQDVIGTEDVAPGSVISYQPIVHNGGGTTAALIMLELFDDPYARHVQRYSNCQYPEPDSNVAVCQFELNLQPGETAQVPAESAVELQVPPNAPQGWLINANYTADGFEEPGPIDREGEFGDGPPLQLEILPDAEFGDGNESFANVLFNVGTNPSDLAAIGAVIDGAVGDEAVVAVGVTNHGPADIPPAQPGAGPPNPNRADTTVTFPEGVTVLEILPPEADPPDPDLPFVSSCVPIVDGEPDFMRRNEAAGLSYECGVSEIALAPGVSWRFRFRVEITSSGTGTGEVAVSEGVNDPDPSNNVAPIQLTASPGGGGGELPVTGPTTALVAGTGFIALVAGLGLYLLARRRPIRAVTD